MNPASSVEYEGLGKSGIAGPSPSEVGDGLGTMYCGLQTTSCGRCCIWSRWSPEREGYRAGYEALRDDVAPLCIVGTSRGPPIALDTCAVREAGSSPSCCRTTGGGKPGWEP